MVLSKTRWQSSLGIARMRVPITWPVGGVPCARTDTTSKPTAFEVTSRRRKGFPSEARVKRGDRVVAGRKELLEKLGRNDPCPCGSGRKFQTLLHAHGRVRRLRPRLLLLGRSRVVVRPIDTLCQPPNKQLQPTVIPRRVRAASAPFHYALAARWTAQRAAAELRRYTLSHACSPIGSL
jgi:hypothetical protein